MERRNVYGGIPIPAGKNYDLAGNFSRIVVSKLMSLAKQNTR